MDALFIPTVHNGKQAPVGQVSGGMETEPEKTEEMVQKEDVCYEYAGYRVRVHFSGSKTLMQCMKNLTERRIEG